MNRGEHSDDLSMIGGILSNGDPRLTLILSQESDNSSCLSIPHFAEGLLIVRTTYKGIAFLRSYEAASAYGAIDCLQSHDASIIHKT
ncbi:hypothetical protein HAX54_053008, partial [Datura stramonium]|nr:hypothetical protein [Datura stramonium]